MKSKNTDYVHITSTIAEFQKQSYSKLKSTCLDEKRLFVDDLFPPNDSSVFKTRRIPGLEWKRPKVKFIPIKGILFEKKRENLFIF